MTLFNKLYWFIITHEDVSTGIILIASIALVLCIKWLMKSIAEYRREENVRKYLDKRNWRE